MLTANKLRDYIMNDLICDHVDVRGDVQCDVQCDDRQHVDPGIVSHQEPP